MLDHLRGQIARIERAAPLPESAAGGSCRREPAPAWTFGDAGIDRLLGGGGLLAGGLHEIKPALAGRNAGWAAHGAAALAFALALTARRCLGPDVAPSAPILCCRPAAAAGELGHFYAPGLRALGLDPARFLFAEPAKAADVLWAMEEGLKSSSLALVLGVLDEVALTPARRLSLAAALHGTPCLLVTHARAGPAAAAATRWRVEPLPAAPNPFDESAPGALSLRVELERCRSEPALAAAVAFVVDWCDEARSFRLAPRLAARSSAPVGAACRA